jgi:ABC-type dipeptide/oligopeptide/nickel transport system permease component
MFLVFWTAPGPRDRAAGAAAAVDAYLGWMGDLLGGELGRTVDGRSIARVVMHGAGITFRLAAGALVLLALLTVPLAGWTVFGRRRGGRLATPFLYVLSCTPVFLYGYFSYLFLVRRYGRIPQADALATELPFSLRLLFGLLPIVFLAVGDAGFIALFRQLRDQLELIRESPFLTGARSRGLPILPHVVRNALPALLVALGERFAHLLGGAVVLEAIFNLRGLGFLCWKAAETRDLRLILTVTLFAVLVVRVSRVLARAGAILLDPRIRLSREATSP